MKGVIKLANEEILVVEEENLITDRLIAVNRVAKVVKGGRRFGFNALVVVGNGNGQVGLGMGKANDVSEAIRKGIEKAKKNIVNITLVDGTIPHGVLGRYGAGKIVLRPAAPGTGVIAGGPARAVLEVAGVKNILTKCLGTTNSHNVAKATVQGLMTLRNQEQINKLRQVTISS